MLLYADDIVLMAENEENLQSMLNTLSDWCRHWRVLINTNKSKCMHFRRGNSQRTQSEFHIGDSKLETVDKYLGVVFHDKMDLSFNCDTIEGWWTSPG